MNNKKAMAKSAIAISMVSVVTLCFSFLKESVFAYFYGANSITDAYTVAIQLPTILFSLISTAISNVALPYYSKELNSNSQAAATHYASNLMTVITILSLGIIAICEIFASPIVSIFAPGLAVEAKTLATLLFRLVLPTIVLTELMNINTSILNVHKSFVLPSLVSIVLNVTYVSFIALLSGSWGIHAALWGTVIGTVLEFGYSVLLRRRFMKYHWVCDPKDDNMISSVKKAVPVFIGIGAAEINKLVDEMVSSFLEAGYISMLNYASKLSTAISSLLIHGITTVVFPEFAESAAKDDDKRMADSFLFSMQLIILLMGPIIVGGTALSTEIISIVYKRGAFTETAVLQTAPLFACYLVCLMFTAFRQVSSRVFYSYGDTSTPMKNSFIGIVINIILDVTLVKFMGAIGLALATTVATMIISFLLLKDLKRRNTAVYYKGLLGLIGKTTLSCGVMYVALKILKSLIEKLGYGLDNFWEVGAYVLIAVIIGAFIYLIMLIILRTKEIRPLLNLVSRRKR